MNTHHLKAIDDTFLGGGVLPKSDKNGTSKLDGRRKNSPPEAGKIKPGEIRNPWGASGKPKVAPPTSMDDLFWHEASRIVSVDDGGPVDAKKRLVQEEFQAALMHGDSAVRARLLAQLQESGARIESQREAIHAFFIEAKAHLTEQFYFAKKYKRPAPDIVPHPDHVEVCGSQVHFFGPTDRRGRETWEWLKASIRVTACHHEIVRTQFKQSGCSTAHAELRSIEKHRRKLMRSVPKGWNWQEEIYCRDSQLEFAKSVVQSLKEIGYVAPDAVD